MKSCDGCFFEDGNYQFQNLFLCGLCYLKANSETEED